MNTKGKKVFTQKNVNSKDIKLLETTVLIKIILIKTIFWNQSSTERLNNLLRIRIRMLFLDSFHKRYVQKCVKRCHNTKERRLRQGKLKVYKKWKSKISNLSSASTESRSSIQYHCVKRVQIRSLSSPYFPVFGLNTEIYGVLDHAKKKKTGSKHLLFPSLKQCLR